MTLILRKPHSATAETDFRRFLTVLPRTRAFEDEDDFLDRGIGLCRSLPRRDLDPVQPNVDRARRQANVLADLHIVPADDHSSSSPSQ
jgi:hypothetical protein